MFLWKYMHIYIYGRVSWYYILSITSQGAPKSTRALYIYVIYGTKHVPTHSINREPVPMAHGFFRRLAGQARLTLAGNYKTGGSCKPLKWQLAVYKHQEGPALEAPA